MNGHNRRWVMVMIGLLIILTIGLLITIDRIASQTDPVVVGMLTITREPIVPTRTPAAESEIEPYPQEATAPLATITATIFPTATLTPTFEAIVTPLAAAGPQAPLLVESELSRFGVGIARSFSDSEAAYSAGLPFGSALNWNVSIAPPEVPADYWQMVRVNQQGIRKIDWDFLAEAIAANRESAWLIGNEPDVKWQDNVTPERYAEIYHDVYTFIKAHDPGAKVAVGGVSQPTPLRRAYLDIVLDTYEVTYGMPMPIDIWNVHAFTLREEADSWGVDIPPGMEGAEGMLYEIEDHDDVDIIAQNLRDFRIWMAGRGYGDKPLVVSEYGILMPADYGFSPQRVSTFLESTFDLFREMNGEDGYGPDQNRLVQWWFWYSIYDDELYSTGNLWDEDTGQLTELGETWSRYINDNAIAP